jgi:glucosamine--fructose-6-phosphate aminotransferase (isomerizing)
MADTLFMQDIMNTPQALRDTLTGIGDHADALAAQFLAAGGQRLVALGSGTSYYAAAASVYLHNTLVSPGGTLVVAAPTGDFSLYPFPLAAADGIVGISASGELIDLLDLFDRLRGQHRLIGITNMADSTLTRSSDEVLLLRAGPGLVPTTTKTFVASVAGLQLFLLGLLQAQGVEAAAALRREMTAIPDRIAASLDQARRQIAGIATRLASCRRIFVFGAGPAWVVALEGALVLKEIAAIPAEGAQTREMAQGTTAVVDASVGVIGVLPPGPGQDAGRRVLAQCAGLGAVTLEVGADPNGLLVDAPCDPLLSPLIYGGPLFVLANELALLRGIDSDHPHWEAGYLQAVRRADGPAGR